jgi:hypothetical protein
MSDNPFQVVCMVNDWPGARGSATIYIGSIPAFERQTIVPASKTSTPVIDGPSSYVTVWLLTLVTVSVIATGWP